MSFIERGTPVFPSEVEAAALPDILTRFEEEGKREALQRSTNGSELIQIVRQAQDLSFAPKNYPPNAESRPQCPSFKIVYAGALLTGRTTPSDLEGLNSLFCGHALENIDDMGRLGPLSGSRGVNYIPFSQCWRVAKELKKLVGFMKVMEETPKLPESGSEEVELRKVLNERSRIKKDNEQRGFVIVTWKSIRDHLPFGTGEAGQPLLSAGPLRANEGQVLARVVYDASLQFDLGGDEYNSLVDWAEKSILNPLLKLVGKDNVSPIRELKNGGLSIKLGWEKTAQKCSQAPNRGFMGEYS